MMGVSLRDHPHSGARLRAHGDRRGCQRGGARRLRLAGLVALLVTLLPGCWLQVGYNGGNTRFNDLERDLTIDNVGSLSTEWTVDANQAVSGIASQLSEPVVSGNRLYVTNVQPDGSGSSQRVVVQSYDIRSGRLLWQRQLVPDAAATTDRPMAAGAQPVVLVDGVLWAPYWYQGQERCSGRIAGLDPATGDVLAVEEAGRPGSPIVAKGSLVAYTEAVDCGGPARLVVRDRESLKTLWTYTFGSRTIFDATPTLAHGKVFVTFGGVLYAFDPDRCREAGTCEPMWTHSGVATERPVAGPEGTVLTVSEHPGDGGSRQGVQALDSATGELSWQTGGTYTAGGVAGIAVAGGTVYVAGSRDAGPIDPDEPPTGGSDAAGNLDVYQPWNVCRPPFCSPVWSVGLGPDMPSTAPVVAGGVVYVAVTTPGDRPAAVVAVDAAGCAERECREVGRVPLDGDVSTGWDHPYQLVVARGRVFVAWTFNAFVPVAHLTSLAPTT